VGNARGLLNWEYVSAKEALRVQVRCHRILLTKKNLINPALVKQVTSPEPLESSYWVGGYCWEKCGSATTLIVGPTIAPGYLHPTRDVLLHKSVCTNQPCWSMLLCRTTGENTLYIVLDKPTSGQVNAVTCNRKFLDIKQKEIKRASVPL